VLQLENNSIKNLHITLECWFGKENSSSASLYSTFDYYLAPQEKTVVSLSKQQTLVLAHKSKYVTIAAFERVQEEHNGHRYERDIQPCLQHFDVEPGLFRSGIYSVTFSA
jgi:hypothetical protein